MPVKAKSHPPKRKAAHASVPPPKWPAFHPLVATSDLSLETLLDDQILVIRSLFTSTLCKNYVSFLSSLPLTTTLGTPKKGDAVRVNDRFEVHDPSFADQLWLSTGLKDLVNGTVSTEDTEDQLITPEERRKLWGGEVCGLNPRIRVYRYSKGQFFDRHCMLSLLLTVVTFFSSAVLFVIEGSFCAIFIYIFQILVPLDLSRSFQLLTLM